MGIFDFFKSAKDKTQSQTSQNSGYVQTNLSDQELMVLINKAISVFAENPESEYDMILEKVKKNIADGDLATAIFRFIPLAYCRLAIKGPKYSDKYIIYKNKEEISFSLSKDRIYSLVLSVCRQKLSQNSFNIMNVLRHSSELNAINNALHGGSRIEDLDCSPVFFLSPQD